MDEYFSYLRCLENDVELQYGKLILCDLRHYMLNYRGRKPYQIWCDDSNIKYFEFYEKPEQAISKFLELKAKIKSNKVRIRRVEWDKRM